MKKRPIPCRDGYEFQVGLYRHGYLLAPAVAKQVADLLLDNIAGEFVDENYR